MSRKAKRAALAQRARTQTGKWPALGKARHFEAHPHDHPCPAGYVRVRVDGGDSHTVITARRYVLVKAGFGVEQRIDRAIAEAQADQPEQEESSSGMK